MVCRRPSAGLGHSSDRVTANAHSLLDCRGTTGPCHIQPSMNPAPLHRRLPISARPDALAACAALALILNAGAIGLAAQASSRWQGVGPPGENAPHRTAVVLIGTPETSPPPAAARVSTVSADRSLPLRRRASPSPPVARTTAAATPALSPQQVLFYPFREVDSPAFPTSDWNLDVYNLDRIGVRRLVFEVLVSDHGQIVGCTVLDPPNLSDDVRRDLERRLSETAVLPALRAGQLVASVRRIELLVADVSPDLQTESDHSSAVTHR